MSTATPTVEDGNLDHRSRMIILVGVMSGMFLASLEGTIINTALVTITTDLGGLDKYTWVGTAYMLTSTAATPLYGKLSDIYGRKLMYQVSISIFIFASVLCSMSQSMEFLVFSRALQGIGGGGLTAMAFIVVGDIIPPRVRGRYTGYLTTLYAISSVIGPLIGGVIVDNFSWRWIFWVNVPIGIAAFLITSATMNIPVDKVKRSIDYLGIFLLVGAVTSLILVLSWAGEEYGWTSNTAILLFLLAALLTIGFLYWEPRANEPLVPPRLIKIPTLRIMIPLLMLFGVGMLGTNAFIPLFLQAVTGVTPTQSGLLLLPMIFGVLTAALIAGRVIERTGRYRKWLLSGSALMAVGMTILSLMSQTNAGLTAGLIGMFVMGFGTGSLGPVSTTVIQNSVEHPDLGITTSMITFFRSLGGAIGLATCGALFNVFARDKVEPQFLHDPRLVKELPEPQKTSVLNALSDSITGTFKWTIPAMILIFVLASMVKEVPLRQTIGPNTGTTD